MSPELKVARVILFVLLALAMVVYFSACKSAKPVVENINFQVEKSVEKDKLTPVEVPGENASLIALFKCDSLNRVLLVSYNELKSRNVNSNFSFTNGQLKYGTKTQPETVYVKSTDRWYYVNRNINHRLIITKKEPKPEPVYINKFGILDWIGLLFCIGLSGYIAKKLLTKKPFITSIKKLLNIN